MFSATITNFGYNLSYENGILVKAKIGNEYILNKSFFNIIRSVKVRPEYMPPAFWGPVNLHAEVNSLKFYKIFYRSGIFSAADFGHIWLLWLPSENITWQSVWSPLKFVKVYIVTHLQFSFVTSSQFPPLPANTSFLENSLFLWLLNWRVSLWAQIQAVPILPLQISG